MTYSTKNPIMFARFFMEIPMEKIQKKLNLFEKCHGKSSEIHVAFFRKVPGECSTEIKDDDTSFVGVSDFQFSDSQITTEYSCRQLLVELEPNLK